MTKYLNSADILRVSIFCLLCLAATVPALAAYRALSNLSADYKDSPDATYIIVGGMAAVFALMPLSIGLMVLRGARLSVIVSSLATGALCAGLLASRLLDA